MPDMLELVVEPGSDKRRLDVYLAEVLSSHYGLALATRSQVQRLIRRGGVSIDGRFVARPAQMIEAGQRIVVLLPSAEPSLAAPEQIPLDVVYEDQHLLVVNKPRGMVVHPAAGHSSGTLVNAVLAHVPELRRDQDAQPLRPGIVHRLDRDTTGLIMVAKDHVTRLRLSRQIQDREVKRSYLALCAGRLNADHGEIVARIARSPRDRKRMAVVREGGRSAATSWRRLASFPGWDLLEVSLQTGRTHQIRVHFAHIGHPVAGDPVYGPRAGARRGRLPAPLCGQALHAWQLEFEHPRSGQLMFLQAPPPPDLAAVLRELYLGSGFAIPSWLKSIAAPGAQW